MGSKTNIYITTLYCVLYLLLSINSVQAQYCSSSGENTYVTGITHVGLNTINNSTNTDNAYTDYTGSISTSLMQGSNYSIQTRLNTAGNYTIHCLVWIDWDQNGVFDESPYDLGTATNETDGATNNSGLSFTVPVSATLGTTRMRVSAKWNQDPSPCENGMDGEVEDYAITVISPDPSPEINILGNSNSITDGDNSTSETNLTDFGETTMGTPIQNSFQIQNQGSEDLIISAITLSNTSDFSISQSLASNTISGGTTDSFEITYNATSGGLQSSMVTISSNDSNEANFTFMVQGETSCPIISLSGSSMTAASCVDCSDASITLGTPSGGVSPYEYSVDGINWSNSNVFSNLYGSFFTVYARDSNGCIGEERITNYLGFNAGAAVIDMGVTPQTENNALIPYGLVYDLVQNYNVPIYWIIDPNKSFVNAQNITNQSDITVTGTTSRTGGSSITSNLLGGPFIIPQEYISTAYPVIETWISNYPGLTVYWNLNAISSAPVNGIITTLANVVIYPKDGDLNDTTDIEEAFFIPAAVPQSSYRRGYISSLDQCDEIYVLSHHTDPDENWTQDDIDDLYDYVTGGGNVWMGCHDVSITESLLTTSEGIQLNFLSENGLIPYKDIKDVSTNYPYLSAYATNDDIDKHDNSFNSNDVLYDITAASNPLMQFLGEIQDAQNGNSERIYVPFSGGWRSTTVRASYDPNHSDLPSGSNRSPGEAAIMAYGPAYGNNRYGTVLYHASHINNSNSGSNEEYVGDRRVFGNYLLESAIRYTKDAGPDQIFSFTSCGIVSTTLDAAIPINSPGVWTIESGTGGSFSDPTNPKSEFYGQENETYTLKWSVNCDEDVVQISFVTECNTLDFDGTDDHISFADNFDVEGPFTIELWIKPEQTSTDTQTVLSKRDANNLSSGYDLRIENNILSFNWDENNQIVSPYALQQNVWKHVAVTFNGSVYRLYIDGIEVNSAYGSLPATPSNKTDFIVGAMDQISAAPYEPLHYFSGAVDELAIWDIALTQKEIQLMMNQEIESTSGQVYGVITKQQIESLNWSNLKGYYQFNQSTDISYGNLIPIGGTIQGRLINSNSVQDETAPVPYTTKADGLWSDTSSTGPWSQDLNIWSPPNGIGIDGSTKVNWNIVKISHNISSDNEDILLSGLIVDTNGKFSILNKDENNDENNTGQCLSISDYLLLNGTIDLVGESQLIQSEGSTVDIVSTGILEIDQQGTSNKYNYNYWGSPVSSQSLGTNGGFSVKEIMYDGTNSSLLTHPTILWTSGYNGSPNPLTLSRSWIYTFNNGPQDDYWSWSYKGESGTIATGLGYTMKGSGASGSHQNYVFMGVPNNGVVTASVSPNNQTLVGNPYPSAIDINQFLEDNTEGYSGSTGSINGTIYFWEHFETNSSHILEQYEGGYAARNMIGATAAISHPGLSQAGYSTAGTPGSYIPVGQGFFVKGSSTGGTIEFNNGQRIHAKETVDNSVFIRSENQNSAEEPIDQVKKLKFQFITPLQVERELLLGFVPNDLANDDFNEGYDSEIIDGFDSDAGFNINDKPHCIQGVGLFDISKKYPLMIDLSESGTIQFKFVSSENFETRPDLYLYDGVNNIYWDLNEADFSMQLESGSYVDRFYVCFESDDQLLSINENQLNKSAKFQLYYSSLRSKLIVLNPKGIAIKKIQIYGMTGQLIKEIDHISTQENYHEFDTPSLSSGAYIALIKTLDSRESVKFLSGK